MDKDGWMDTMSVGLLDSRTVICIASRIVRVGNIFLPSAICMGGTIS